jgi:hypothetical protein
MANITLLPTSYPTTVDTYTTQVPGDIVRATHYNGLAGAVIALETFVNTILVPGVVFTAGSVPFAGPTGLLTQDNASFSFDDAANRLTVANLTVPTGLTLSGATITGTPTWSSSQAITLSTAAQPNITSLGTLAANLLFVDATYDIGASGATRPRDIFLSRNLVVGSGLTLTGVTVTGAPTWSSAQAITLSTAAQPSITSLGTLAANLLFVDATHDIGASGATRPRDLFLSRNAVVGADLTVGDQLIVSGTGPHAIGGAVNTRYALVQTGSFTGVGATANAGTQLENALTNASAVSLYGLRLAQTLTNIAGATAEMAWLHIVPSAITVTAGSVTAAAALKIDAAPSGATANYALWINSGNQRMGNASYVTWGATPTTVGPSVYGDTTQLALVGGTTGTIWYANNAATELGRVHEAGGFQLATAAPATPVAKTLYEDSIIKGWLKASGAGVPVIDDDLNVSSITDNGVGDFTINWATAFANANYAVTCIGVLDRTVARSQPMLDHDFPPTASACRILFLDAGETLADPISFWSIMAIGNN